MHYVYVLTNRYNKYYIGYTDDIERRFRQHQNEDGSYVLIYYEAYQFSKLARDRERRLKYYGSAWRGLKKRLGCSSSHPAL